MIRTKEATDAVNRVSTGLLMAQVPNRWGATKTIAAFKIAIRKIIETEQLCIQASLIGSLARQSEEKAKFVMFSLHSAAPLSRTTNSEQIAIVGSIQR